MAMQRPTVPRVPTSHTGKEEAESPELTGHGHRLPGPVPPWLREPSAKKGESSSWL